MIKTIFTGLVLLCFLVSYNLYLYKLATAVCDMHIMKLWSYYSIGGLMLGCFVSEWLEVDSYFQFLFINVCKLVFLVTVSVIILTHHRILINPYYGLSIIDFGTAIATLMILISGGRHGYFSNK